MSDGRAWQGNVKTRLYERVRARGYAVPLHLLAEELGLPRHSARGLPGWRPLGPDDELLRTPLPDEEV